MANITTSASGYRAHHAAAMVPLFAAVCTALVSGAAGGGRGPSRAAVAFECTGRLLTFENAALLCGSDRSKSLGHFAGDTITRDWSALLSGGLRRMESGAVLLRLGVK
jgi:hypothetical protein